MTRSQNGWPERLLVSSQPLQVLPVDGIPDHDCAVLATAEKVSGETERAVELHASHST
jgi:hypothetical protein